MQLNHPFGLTIIPQESQEEILVNGSVFPWLLAYDYFFRVYQYAPMDLHLHLTLPGGESPGLLLFRTLNMQPARTVLRALQRLHWVFSDLLQATQKGGVSWHLKTIFGPGCRCQSPQTGDSKKPEGGGPQVGP